MANTPDYSWPPMEKRKQIGQRYSRLDGINKSTGRIDEERNDGRRGDQLVQQFQPLSL